jgi:hypothetical protein
MDLEQAKRDWEKAKADTQVCYEAYKRSEERLRLALQTYLNLKRGAKQGDRVLVRTYRHGENVDQRTMPLSVVEWLVVKWNSDTCLIARKRLKRGGWHSRTQSLYLHDYRTIEKLED